MLNKLQLPLLSLISSSCHHHHYHLLFSQEISFSYWNKMSNNSESTFAFQKISVLSQHFSSSWGLTKPPGVWRGSYGWCSSVGNHLSTLCGLLREICCPGKSFLWMAIWLLKWSWAFLCLSAYGSRALLGVEQLDISRWGWSFLLAAPSPHSYMKPSGLLVSTSRVWVCERCSWQTLSRIWS